MISVCILAKNCAETLEKTLASTRSFPEALLLDNGSTDGTLKIACAFPNVRVFESEFLGFGPLRNKAASMASCDWILALDSDEILSPPLLEEISQLKLDPSFAYSIPRHNYYNGKRIRGCGWGGDKVIRLYHRSVARYHTDLVHESLDSSNTKIVELKHPILHTPYRSTADFLAKMQNYSTLFAQQYKGKRTSSFGKALSHALFAFFRSYILKRGLFCGAEGFTLSLYNANTAFYKYMKLNELNKNLR